MDRLTARPKREAYIPDRPGYDRELPGFRRIAEGRPAVVVAAPEPGDGSAAVSFACGFGPPVAVRATGHGIVAPAEGGVVITTRWTGAVPTGAHPRTAYAEAGTRRRQVASAAARCALAPESS
ncbi:FAD-binding protein [Streptomyces iconiensis]|nr:FAD-binding protein [Streptomyces iconiensis]